jgi:NAD(P)H-hydrate epimerase
MIPLLDATEMRHLEAESISRWGISSLVLQEHAALGALALIPPGQRIQVLAGPGNNGGDALALARLARLRGEAVEVWVLDPQPTWKGDAALQARLWEGLGGGYRFTRKPTEVIEGFRGWVVDGLFGLGVRLPLHGLAEAWVSALHDALIDAGSEVPFRVLALDLPSGLSPDSSDVTGLAIPAHRTACFGRLKVCHGLRPARELCGSISVIPLPLRGDIQARLHLLENPGKPFPQPWYSHKRDFGHVAVRAGSIGMSGASVLAALGALRMGAGLVTVLAPPELRAEIAAQVPEAMVLPWQGRVPEGIDVLLVGPGGVVDVPEWSGPLVLDASALRPGEGPRWMNRPETVITPHSGEFARLFGLKKTLGHQTSERLDRVRMVSGGPGILVLKGAQSLIAGADSGQIWINPTGHRGLSTGGTGDFLAGMVAAKVGMWKKSWSHASAPDGLGLRKAVAEAVWLHGAAADRLGPGPLLVRDLGESLADLLRELHAD